MAIPLTLPGRRSGKPNYVERIPPQRADDPEGCQNSDFGCKQPIATLEPGSEPSAPSLGLEAHVPEQLELGCLGGGGLDGTGEAAQHEPGREIVVSGGG